MIDIDVGEVGCDHYAFDMVRFVQKDDFTTLTWRIVTTFIERVDDIRGVITTVRGCNDAFAINRVLVCMVIDPGLSIDPANERSQNEG